MTDLEFEHQKNLVDMRLGMASKEKLVEWADLVAEDYWYGLTFGGYLREMVDFLSEDGVNTDSIKVMSYVDEFLEEVESQ